MTPHAPVSIPTPLVSLSVIFRFLTCLLVCLFYSCLSLAQTPPQQFVYASTPVTTTTSQVSGFAKDPGTGNLTPTAVATVADRLEGGLLAVDAKGRFVFILNPTTSKISMFAVNPNTGNLS